MPTCFRLLPLGVLLKTKVLLTPRSWSRVLPVTLQIPISTSRFLALWWRKLTGEFALPGRVCLYRFLFSCLQHLAEHSAVATQYSIVEKKEKKSLRQPRGRVH
eukprot:1156551-Pelagomonas_calceolata.AAC.1